MSLGTHSLRLHQVGLPDDLVGRALHYTAGLGKSGPNTHEVLVDIASGLAAFVDTPDIC